jgi:glycosyltransferase involved in cell wall biosynthesis
MKTICMITHDSPYIDRRILLQAKALIEQGYKVSIIHPFGEANSDFENVGIDYVTLSIDSNVKNILTSMKSIIRELVPQSLYTFLKKSYFKVAPSDFIDYEDELKQKAVEKDYDVYVAHDLPALPIAHFAAKEKSAQLVYDAHEFFTGQIALPQEKRVFLAELEKELIPDVDLMFTVNKDIAKLFEQSYGTTDIKILYNAMEAKEVEDIVNLHHILNLPKEKTILLYQGGFLEDRNLELLVTSARYLPDDIVLVMLGYSFLEKKLKSLADKLCILGKKVIFMDRVPQKELLRYTAGADFGIIPYPDIDLNTKYCTPNKMFEFLTANVPMIANNSLVTVGNMFKEFHLGSTISFASAKDVAKGVEEAVRTMDREEIKRSLKLAQKKLSWEAQEEVLIKAYDELTKR